MITKESLQIIRDPSSILIAFILPFLLLFIFGYGVNLDNNRVKIGLVLEEQTPDSVSLARAFADSRFVDLHVGNNRRHFENELASGRLRGVVVIPQSFSVRLAAGEQYAPVQVLADGSEPNIASFVQNYSHGIMQSWLLHQLRDRGVDLSGPTINVDTRIWYNPELKSRNFLIPGSIAIIMTLIASLLTALVVAREWERGTMEALMTTPITITQILLGKLIPYFLLAVGSMVICWLVATVWYGIPFHGSFIALLAVTSVFLLAALGQGLLISTVAKDQFLASQIAMVAAFLPAFMLSGFIFEISTMPAPLQALTYAFAARYFVSSLQTIFLVGNVWSLLLFSMLGMLVIALVFFLLIVRKTTMRLDA